MNFFSNLTFYGNSSKDYLMAISIFILALFILKLVQKFVTTRLKKLASKTKTDIDDALVEIISNIKPPFYFVIAAYFGINYLTLSEKANQIINIIFLAVIVYEGVNGLQRIIKFFAYRALKKEDDDKQAMATVKTLNIFISIVLWSLGILLVLSNTGINITSLIAGLGIGGIAIALALQNILSDVFSSFSILIDKPFQVGDLIKIGTDMGVVEKIGIKTTRLRTLDGQVLIVANQELTTARLENFHQLKKRRALFSLGVIYETNAEILEKIPKIIQDIVTKQAETEFDRCHFKSYGDFSLNFEISFYVNANDYKHYLDVLEAINLEIFKKFKTENISFAYPTHLEYQKSI